MLSYEQWQARQETYEDYKSRQEKIEREVEQARQAIKQAGTNVDPLTAEVEKFGCNLADPYGFYGDDDVPMCWGKLLFARSPDGVWVLFEDIPEKIREALNARLAAGHFAADDDLFF